MLRSILDHAHSTALFYAFCTPWSANRIRPETREVITGCTFLFLYIKFDIFVSKSPLLLIVSDRGSREFDGQILLYRCFEIWKCHIFWLVLGTLSCSGVYPTAVYASICLQKMACTVLSSTAFYLLTLRKSSS